MTTSQKRSTRTPTATLLAPALEARKHDPKIAPRLLLDAFRQRVKEVMPNPDPDLWVAARQLTRDIDDLAVESVCWSLLLFEKDFGGIGNFNDEQWEDCFDAAELILLMLEQEYV